MCDCIKAVNTDLKEHNIGLVTNLIGEPIAVIETYVLKPKRGFRGPKMFATFCPFCGEKYPERTARVVAAAE